MTVIAMMVKIMMMKMMLRMRRPSVAFANFSSVSTRNLNKRGSEEAFTYKDQNIFKVSSKYLQSIFKV